MYSEFVFDEDGIPMYPYPGGNAYNITFVCHTALYQLSLFQRFGNVAARLEFLKLAHWIAGYGTEQDGALKFFYSHRIPGLNTPWISALGQGRSISVLTRAFEETGEEQFFRLAQQAKKPLEIPVSEGGVAAVFPDGGIAFEEYPKSTPNLVLNGMITAIFGVADLVRLDCDESKDLLRQIISSLEANIERYDLGFASRYDLTGPVPRIASWEYHQYHVMQLWALFELTGVDRFREMATKWGSTKRGIKWLFFRNACRVIHRFKP